MYRFHGIDGADVTRLRAATTDDFGHPIRRLDDADTYPCRYTLREVAARDVGVLLLAYRPPRPQGVYGHPTAIFLSARAGEPFRAADVVPEIVARRHVALRAFDSAGRLLYAHNRLAGPGEHEAAVRAALALPDVAHVNVHTAQAGCFLCTVVRSGAPS